MVYFLGWLAAVLAGVVIPVEDVEPDAFPSWDVVCCFGFVLPGWEFVGFAVVGVFGCYFWAAEFVADFRCSRHSLHRSSGSILHRMGI